MEAQYQYQAYADTTRQAPNIMKGAGKQVSIQADRHTHKVATACSQNYVPFLGQSNRFTKEHSQSPPIGLYETKSCFLPKYNFSQLKLKWLKYMAMQQKKMSIFKSSQQRFKDKPTSITSQLFYEGSNNYWRSSSSMSVVRSHSQVSCSNSRKTTAKKVYPSIPTSYNKYGYLYNNGKMQPIEKKDYQLEQERNDRTHYIYTLSGYRRYKKMAQAKGALASLCKNSEIINPAALDNIKYKLQFKQITNTKENTTIIKASSKDIKRKRFIRLESTSPQYKIYSLESQNSIGPWTYEMTAKTLKPLYKKYEFQFFGSSEVRFKYSVVETKKGVPLIELIKERQRREGYDIKKRTVPIKKIVRISVLYKMNETELEKDKKYLQIRYDRKHGRSSKLFEKAHLYVSSSSVRPNSELESGVIKSFCIKRRHR